MYWTKVVHVQRLLHIIFIMLIHTTFGFGKNRIPAYHAMEDKPARTEFISITTNTNSNPTTTINTPKQTTNINTNTNNRNNKPTTPAPTPSNPNECDSYTQIINSTDLYIPYSVEIYKSDTSPILSYVNNTSIYKQVFNPSWIHRSDAVPHGGLMVQAQNCSLQPGNCTNCNETPELVYTPCDPITGRCDIIDKTSQSGTIPYDNLPNVSIYTQIIQDTNYNQNPCIFYWNETDLYYLFQNTLCANNHKEPTTCFNLYTTATPRNISSFKEKGGAFPNNNKITGPASLLGHNISESNAKYKYAYYLFFGGEGHISVTNSCKISKWSNIDYTPWLLPRNTYFDNIGVESGPSPIKLRDGNYLMLYNGYTISNNNINTANIPIDINGNHQQIVPHKAKHYQIGWVILDKHNPTKILQRSDKPLLTAKYDYEIGNAPYTCTQGSSVYVKAIIPLDDNVMENLNNETEYFRVYFSAADTSIGTAVISISHAKNDNTDREWVEIAIIVSIGCGIFVMIMFLIIWCRKNKGNDGLLVDLAIEPQFLSIASARMPRDEEISGMNHNGISYVTGSLDSKKRSHSRHSKHSNRQKKRGRMVYETKDNPNHIHVHTTECYEDDSKGNCGIVHGHGNGDDNVLNTSLQSNVSTSTSCSSNSHSSPSESYCMECNGKYHTNDKREISESNTKSETIRLSQISFRMNETLEKDSPSNQYDNTIKIAGVTPDDIAFSFTTNNHNNFGEPFIQ